jgi:hypothetical protein
LSITSDEQYESIPDDEIALLARKLAVSREGDHLGDVLNVATPPTSSPTAPRVKSSTPPTSMTIPSGTTTVRAMIRRNTASGTKRTRNFIR